MTYNTHVLTFVESPLFTKHIYNYLSDTEYAAFQLYLASAPDAGDIVKESGGIRKIRWGRKGHGKSSGVRILYFTRLQRGEIWLLLVYAKSAVDTVQGHILKALREEMENVD